MKCVTQHKLLVCDTRIVKSEDRCKKFVPNWRVWKIQQADLQGKFCENFTSEINHISGEQIDVIWSRLKEGFTLCYREDLCVDKERHMEKANLVVE